MTNNKRNLAVALNSAVDLLATQVASKPGIPLIASVGYYRHRGGRIRAHFRVPAFAADALPLAFNGRWRVEATKLIDAYTNKIVDGYVWIRDGNGVEFPRNARGRLMRPPNITRNQVCKSQKLALIPIREGFIAAALTGMAPAAANDNAPPKGHEMFAMDPGSDRFRRLPMLNSLTTTGRAGKARVKFLINDNSRQSTTKAGDQCYTARFIIDAVLDALGLDAFHIDVCSMRVDGRYDLNLPNAVNIPPGGWGTTPLRLRTRESVVGHVPAIQYFTNDAIYGSLARDWLGVIWCNPPYTKRLWATFLEKANQEVEKGNAKIVVCLVPRDDTGDHAEHLYGANAHIIGLTKMIPFFKKEKVVNGEIKRNIIEVIRGNQLVVFGKGEETRSFLLRLCANLLAIEYISQAHYDRYVEQFEDSRRLTA